MRNFVFIFISFLTVIAVSNPKLYAQDYAKQGTWEVGGNISYTSITSVSNGETSDNALGIFSLGVPVYYFVIDGLELGIIPNYENLSLGDNSASAFDILFGAAYNIETKSVAYPFIEGRIGYNTTSNGNTRSGMAWEAIGGVKVQVGGNALINIGIGYSQSTLELENHEGERTGTNTFGVRAGFIVFFPK